MPCSYTSLSLLLPWCDVTEIDTFHGETKCNINSYIFYDECERRRHPPFHLPTTLLPQMLGRQLPSLQLQEIRFFLIQARPWLRMQRQEWHDRDLLFSKQIWWDLPVNDFQLTSSTYYNLKMSMANEYQAENNTFNGQPIVYWRITEQACVTSYRLCYESWTTVW